MIFGEELHAGPPGTQAVPQPEAGGAFESGIFLVDKPAGPTSFQMVRQIRKVLQMKKVGHAGTLDPFASGLLIICAGRPATRMIGSLMDGTKEYVATLRLGVETDTQDPEGQVISRRPVPALEDADIERCLLAFRGELLQTPPQFSALKHKGKPLYYYARKGIEVEKEARRVCVDELQCLGRATESLTIRVVCSKGTYIRTLALDIGRFLGCGAYLTALRRVRSGAFSVDAAIDGASLQHMDREDMVSLLRHSLSIDEARGRLQGLS